LPYVSETYEFPVVAGMANSGPVSLAEHCTKIAKEFFGDQAFDLTIELVGRKGQWVIQAQARANVRVEDKFDGS
jgi:hypothetical protein